MTNRNAKATSDASYCPRVQLRGKSRLDLGLLFFVGSAISLGTILSIGSFATAATTGDKGIASLQSEARSSFVRGDYEAAILQWTQVAERLKSTGEFLEESRVRAALAEAHQELGQQKESIEQLERSLQVAEQADDLAWRASVKGQLGGAYLLLSLDKQAEAYLDDGLQEARGVGARGVEARILNNLGNLYQMRHQYRDALGAYAVATTTAQQLHNHALAATAATNAAGVALDKGARDDAVKYLEAARTETRALSNSRQKAYLLIRQARAHQRLAVLTAADPSAAASAVQRLQEAVSTAENIGDSRAASWAYGEMGALYEEGARYNESLELTQRAIFHAQHVYAPEILYRWEWQKARALKARGDTTTAIDAYRKAVDTLQVSRADASRSVSSDSEVYREDTASVYLELADLLLRASERRNDAGQVQALLVEARDTVELLKAAELENYFQDDCVAAVRARIKNLDETIADTSAVVYPIVLPDRTELLVSFSTGLERFSTTVSEAALKQEVRKFRGNLEKVTTRQYMRQARQLYSWLIRPMEPALDQNGIDTLIFVPDASLRLIPLSALHDGSEFLINRYALATTPSLRLTDPRPIERTDIKLLLNGLSLPVEDYPPLIHVTSELEAIEDL